MKFALKSIKAKLLGALILLTLVVVCLSVVVWATFSRVAALQYILIDESLPKIQVAETLAKHSLEFYDLSVALGRKLSLDDYLNLELQVARAQYLIEEDLQLLLRIPYSQAELMAAENSLNQLSASFKSVLSLQGQVVANDKLFDDDYQLIVKTVDEVLVDLKLIYIELAEEEKILGLNTLIEIRYDVQRFEALVDWLRFVTTRRELEEQEDQYRHLLQRLVTHLLELDEDVKHRILPKLYLFNALFLKEKNVFAQTEENLLAYMDIERLRGEELQLIDSIGTIYESIYHSVDEELNKDAKSVLSMGRNLKLVLLGALFIFFGVVLVLYFIFIRPQIINRILALSQSTLQIANNQYDTPIPCGGNDEISVMAESLAYFRSELVGKEEVQRSLAHRERELSVVINNAIEGMLTVSISGAISSINPEGRKLFKFAADNESNTYGNVVDFFPLLRAEFLTHAQQAPFYEGDGLVVCSDKEVKAICTDGSTFDAEVSVILIRLADAYVYSCFVRDVSAEKEAHRQMDALVGELTASNEDLERFAWSCSHDLQEPVRMVVSFSQLLQAKLGDSLEEKPKEYLDYIISSGIHAQQLIQGILAYSRLDKTDIEKVCVSIDDICLQVKTLLHGLIDEQRSSFSWEHGHIKINIVESQMVQLLLNLVANGLKYNKSSPPEVQVSAAEDETHWYLRVSDNGIGIEEKYIPKIFDAFTRLVRRRDYAGSGLGLALCQKVAAKHGGVINVRSKINEGSCFEVKLPKYQ